MHFMYMSEMVMNSRMRQSFWECWILKLLLFRLPFLDKKANYNFSIIGSTLPLPAQNPSSHHFYSMGKLWDIFRDIRESMVEVQDCWNDGHFYWYKTIHAFPGCPLRNGEMLMLWCGAQCYAASKFLGGQFNGNVKIFSRTRIPMVHPSSPRCRQW